MTISEGEAPRTSARNAESWDALRPLQAVFGSLGRALLLVDASWHVLFATDSLDALVCPGSFRKVLGRPLGELVGAELLRVGGPLQTVVDAGGRDEGRRAFLRCPDGGARLVSVTIAALDEDQIAALHPQARCMVVLRPAEDDHVLLERGAGAVGFVAASAPMLRIVHTIEQLQNREAPVLITGESGTGKEVIARAIHAHSPRRAGPFVAVNCAAIPRDLLESELFGHVRGAFTSAFSDREGQFARAKGGTLFLDEIGDMPADLQVKLLRVVQDREYCRVGESRSRPLDARILSATNVDLAKALPTGAFREDLYYRLAVVPIRVPPLRERPEDIPSLARHALARLGAREARTWILSADAERALLRYPWPGNVRQLENALEYAVVLCEGGLIHAGLLPPEIQANEDGPGSLAAVDAIPTGLDDRERVLYALEHHQWRRADAAIALGMSRTTLWRRMRDLGLE